MLLLVNGGTASLHRLGYAEGLGHLLSPRCGNSIKTIISTGLPWAADNDAYLAWSRERYLKMLDKITGHPRCLFVVAPDVLGNAAQTRTLFDTWHDELVNRQLPIAYVSQDGEQGSAVPWDQIAALFVGGTTKWKLSHASKELVVEAKRRGKWTHMGRVNSHERIRIAFGWGIDSVDGTSMSRYGDTYLKEFLSFIQSLSLQEVLP